MQARALDHHHTPETLPVIEDIPTGLTLNGVVYPDSTGLLVATAQGPANSVLTANAGAPAFSATPTVTKLTATQTIGAGMQLDKAGDTDRSFQRWHQGTQWWQAGFRATPYTWVLESQNAASPADDSGWKQVLSATTAGTVSLAGTSGTANALIAGAGIQLGGPTGGDKGVGTLNASGDLYKNNLAYGNPEYVLEHWATGRIERFADRDGAAEYDGLRPLTTVEASCRETCALPRVHEARQRHGDGFGIFAGGDAVLASLEEAYLYLFQQARTIAALEARVAALEGR